MFWAEGTVCEKALGQDQDQPCLCGRIIEVTHVAEAE